MLEKLRDKPNHIKQTISIVVTAVIFSGIFFVWISSKDARSVEVEVREKTVSPIDGVTSMFDGLIAGFKEKMSNSSPTMDDVGGVIDVPAVDEFDLSGVVVIDPSATTTISE